MTIIAATWGRLSTTVRTFVVIGLVIVLGLLLWYRGTQVWNGIGNYLFDRQINAERRKVEKELEDAARQKQELERTLIEFAKAKEALAAAVKEREIREQIFNDKTKTAKEKVAEYEAAMRAAPVSTDPTGVTTDDLCSRAKAIGSSQATISALCSE